MGRRHGDGNWYEIEVDVLLDERWSARLPGFAIHPARNRQTVLVAFLTDQAALHGALRTLRDLAIPLVAVRRLDDTEAVRFAADGGTGTEGERR